MPVTGPDFISLQVRDLDACQQFYQRYLRVDRSPAGPPHAMVFETAPITFALRDLIPGTDLDAVAQPGVGADTRLPDPRVGDEMIFYSLRTELRGGRPVRQFTARATITGDRPYRAHVSDDFRPWRLAAPFHACHRIHACRRIKAKPVGERLSFIPDPAHWGFPFRRGLFPTPRAGFELLRTLVTAD